jgi:hypothetical protein
LILSEELLTLSLSSPKVISTFLPVAFISELGIKCNKPFSELGDTQTLPEIITEQLNVKFFADSTRLNVGEDTSLVSCR